jgi:hypothetical protein
MRFYAEVKKFYRKIKEAKEEGYNKSSVSDTKFAHPSRAGRGISLRPRLWNSLTS